MPLAASTFSASRSAVQADVELALQRDEVEGRALGDLAGEDPAGEGLDGLAVHAAARVWRHAVCLSRWSVAGRRQAEAFVTLQPPSTTRLVPVM